MDKVIKTPYFKTNATTRKCLWNHFWGVLHSGERDKTFSIAQNMRSVCASHCTMAPNRVFNAWISSNSLSLLLLLARRLTHHRKWALKTISCPSSTYKSFTKEKQEEHTVLRLVVKEYREKNVVNYKCIKIRGKAVETSLSLHGRSSGLNIAFWVICFLQAPNCCSLSLFTCLCLRSLFLSSFHPPLFLALAYHPSFSLSLFHLPNPYRRPADVSSG